jgi:hypothetical protein
MGLAIKVVAALDFGFHLIFPHFIYDNSVMGENDNAHTLVLACV